MKRSHLAKKKVDIRLEIKYQQRIQAHTYTHIDTHVYTSETKIELYFPMSIILFRHLKNKTK